MDESVLDATLMFSRKYFVHDTGSEGRANNFGGVGTAKSVERVVESSSGVAVVGTIVWMDAVEESVSVEVSVVSSCMSSFTEDDGVGGGNFASRALSRSLGCSITKFAKLIDVSKMTTTRFALTRLNTFMRN